MIVVGGWPGRNVVGLNGAFGVRPAGFAPATDFPNPFSNDVDPGDDTTEFVAVVTALPASGVATLNDDGGYSLVGAADGTHTTTFTLYTWAQGGPLTQHTPPEDLVSIVGLAAAFVVAPASIASTSRVGTPTVEFADPDPGPGVPDFDVRPASIASTSRVGTPTFHFVNGGGYMPESVHARRLVVTLDPRLHGTSLPGSGGPFLQPFPFAPGCHLDIEWDWRNWLAEGDALSAFSLAWAGEQIGAISDAVEGAGVVAAWLTVPAGAQEGERGELVCEITTVAGRIDSRKFEMLVKRL